MLGGHMARSFLVFLGLFLLLNNTNAANILAVFSYCFPSPFLFVTPYIKALVEQGHQLTIISGENFLEDIHGVQHIRVKLLDHLMEDILDFDFTGIYPISKWDEASIISQFFVNSSHYILSNSDVQALLHNKNAQFDMVIIQASHTDALYGFAQHFNAPLVGLSAYGTAWNIDYLAGNKAPSIYEPMQPEGYSNGFGVMDKLRNWIYITEEWLIDRMVYLPKQIQLYKHYFNRSENELYDIRRNFSLMLINHHFSLGRARSNVPNVVEVAGMHLSNPVEELDTNLKRFLDESTEGFIYFSMGLEITYSWIPPNVLQIIGECFQKLNMRIVCKSDFDNFPQSSDRIYISKLFPQRAILSHPNIKLFITHGGILSIIEAAFQGVPMLCLPMYYDQFGNADRMRHAKVAQSIPIVTMTIEAMTQAVNEIITDPIYRENAKKMAMRLRDQPMSPLENAVWWTEYVLRHQGAPHMRLSEQDMSFMQYYSLDIASVIFGRIGIAILIVTCVGLKLLTFFLRSMRMSFEHF